MGMHISAAEILVIVAFVCPLNHLVMLGTNIHQERARPSCIVLQGADCPS